MFVHTDDPIVTFDMAMEPYPLASIPRCIVTKHLKLHMDILEGPGMHHMTIVESAIPELQWVPVRFRRVHT